MDGTVRTTSQQETGALPARRALVARARRALWDLLRERTRGCLLARSAVRRRLRDFLRRSAAGRLWAILRSAALAASVAAALAAPRAARAQGVEFPAIELADVAGGQGGFLVRGEGQPRSGAGASVSGAGDVNGDGIPDLIIRGTTGPAYVVFGKAGGEAIQLSEVEAGRGGFVIRGTAEHDTSGSSVSGAGDVNGDGLEDLLVGAPEAEPGGRYPAGESYVVFGKAGTEAVDLSDVEAGRGGFVIRGRLAGDYSGFSVSGAGDVNGDGLEDLLVGAPRFCDKCPAGGGASYVVFGKAGGEAVELSEVGAGRGGFVILSIGGHGYLGFSVSGAGDVNGDGLQDLLVGVPRASTSNNSYVVFGKTGTEAVFAGLGGFAIRRSAANDYAGSSVSGAGDVNGDGLEDLLVGAPAADPGGRQDAGASYIVFGKPTGEPVQLSEVEASRGGFAIRGSRGGDRSGSSVSGAGDVNGDGLPDLLVASSLADARYPALSGAAYVVFGRRNAGALPRFRRGAVRGEQAINISDAVRLLRYLFLGDPEPPCLDAADADDSGRLNVTDAVRVLLYLFLGGAAPPDPGPTNCGVDPTDDALRCATATDDCQL